MHRYETDLSTKANQHKYEGDFNDGWISRLRVIEQNWPGHKAIKASAAGSTKEQQRAKEPEQQTR